MKKSLIVLMMILTMATTAEASGQKHRHNPNVTVNVNNSQTGINSSNANNPADADSTGIVAYSDTTSVDSAGVTTPLPGNSNDWDDFDDDPFSALNNLVNVGVGGTIVAICGILFLLVLLLAPLIAIIAIIWILVKNRNQRLKLAEKAMENGQPIPNEALNIPADTDADLWNKGIKNLFLGLGLIACGHFIIGDLLQGIGIVMAFYGAGQAIIARSSRKKREKEEIEESEELKDLDTNK
ncbi:MAG: translation initiation factor IF-2 [Prevotella sp.]|nr:translation initiation factor IF-2 [Prevotella sp.]